MTPFVLFMVVRVTKSPRTGDYDVFTTTDLAEAEAEYYECSMHPDNGGFGTYLTLSKVTFDGTNSQGSEEVLRRDDFDPDPPRALTDEELRRVMG